MDNEFLKEKQADISTRLIPAVVPAAIITVVGIVGNIFTIIFFSRSLKRTVPVVLIKYLAVADLVTCVVSIPVISEMVLNIRYDPKASILCKVSHFMGNWTIGASWTFLTLINIDRFRKICHPLGRQLPISAIKYVGTGAVILFILSSARLLATFDITEVNVTVSGNETVTGFHCVASCENLTTVCIVFYFVDFVFIATGILIAVILYSRIIYTLLKSRYEMSRRPKFQNNLKLGTISKDEFSLSSNENGSELTDICVITELSDKAETCLNKNPSDEANNEKGETRSQKNKAECQKNTNEIQKNKTESQKTKPEGQKINTESLKNKTESQENKENGETETKEKMTENLKNNIKSETKKTVNQRNKTVIQRTSTGFDFCSVQRKPVEWNVTLMMFATTVVFLFCFIPYFIIRILLRLVLNADEEDNYNAVIQFCLKLPYLNSAANPVIYSIFNVKFRRFIKSLFLKCCKCCRQ